jgi:predicted dehydrogenase
MSHSGSKLRVGLISAAWGAYAHLPAWRSLEDVEVVGICTSRRETAEAAARQHGIERPFWDYRAMASDPDIDIVDCGTRPNWRRDMVLAALGAGKHVYNGIPFTDSFESSRRVMEVWNDSGLIGGVDAFSEWFPAHRMLREMVQDGFLGKPFACNVQFHISLFNRPRRDFPYTWFQHGEHGCSALRNLGSHALHVLVKVFGEVESVVGYDAQYLDEWKFDDGTTVRPEITDTAALLLRYANGMVGTLTTCWNVTAGGSGWVLEAYGSRGRLRVQAPPSFPAHDTTELFAGTADSTCLERVDIPQRLRGLPDGARGDTLTPPAAVPMAWSFRDILRAVREGGSCEPDFAQAWKVERILEAARRSQQTRAWVELADVV